MQQQVFRQCSRVPGSATPGLQAIQQPHCMPSRQDSSKTELQAAHGTAWWRPRATALKLFMGRASSSVNASAWATQAMVRTSNMRRHLCILNEGRRQQTVPCCSSADRISHAQPQHTHLAAASLARVFPPKAHEVYAEANDAFRAIVLVEDLQYNNMPRVWGCPQLYVQKQALGQSPGHN
jgi:hypothetical protein